MIQIMGKCEQREEKNYLNSGETFKEQNKTHKESILFETNLYTA